MKKLVKKQSGGTKPITARPKTPSIKKPDYSNSSFNSAFKNSRENKESEFIYKGERYNTKGVVTGAPKVVNSAPMKKKGGAIKSKKK